MKNILFFTLLFAAASCFSQIQTLKPQSSEMYMPAPVSKSIAKETRQKQRIYYTLNGSTYFWDCDKIEKVNGGYLVVTTLESGNTKERFVSDSAKLTINKLR